MARLLSLIVLMMVCSMGSAHEWWSVDDDDLCFFGEVGGGVSMGSHAYRSSLGKNQMGWAGYVEGRYRLNNRHFDIGLQLGLGEFGRKPLKGDSRKFGFCDIMITFNYNLFASKRMTPFIGAGVGLVNDTALDFIAESIRPGGPYGYDYYDCNKNFECGAMMRVGVQIGSHIRLAGGYKWLDRQSSHYFVTLGFSYGFGSR